ITSLRFSLPRQSDRLFGSCLDARELVFVVADAGGKPDVVEQPVVTVDIEVERPGDDAVPRLAIDRPELLEDLEAGRGIPLDGFQPGKRARRGVPGRVHIAEINRPAPRALRVQRRGE